MCCGTGRRTIRIIVANPTDHFNRSKQGRRPINALSRMTAACRAWMKMVERGDNWPVFLGLAREAGKPAMRVQAGGRLASCFRGAYFTLAMVSVHDDRIMTPISLGTALTDDERWRSGQLPGRFSYWYPRSITGTRPPGCRTARRSGRRGQAARRGSLPRPRGRRRAPR